MGTGEAINAFIESGDFDAADGENFMFSWRMVPDIMFRGTPDPAAIVTVSLRGRDYPGSDLTTVATGDVMPSTKQIFWRARNRHWSFRAESNDTGYGWRLGKARIEVRLDGRR